MVEVRRYKITNKDGGKEARWIVRVRWCEYWSDEPDATCIIEPTIAQMASIPVNKHLSFIQIVSNPFPYYPQFTEVYFQPDETGSSQGDVNTWQPGFVTDENEYQYRVTYMNANWKPHPLLALEEGYDMEDEDKRARRDAAERGKIKMTYKSDLIRKRLKADNKRLRRAKEIKLEGVRRAQEEVNAATAKVELTEKIRSATGEEEGEDAPERNFEEEDANHQEAVLALEAAKKKLEQAITFAREADPTDLEEQPEEDDDGGDPEDSQRRLSVSRPSISQQPDTSVIYAIDYAKLDPTYIYDPDLQRMDENGGGDDEDADGMVVRDEEALELEMTRADPNEVPHPSQWLDEHGEEKVPTPMVGDPEQAAWEVRQAQKRLKAAKKRKDSTGFGGASDNGGGDEFFDPDAPADSDDQDGESEDSDDSDGSSLNGRSRPRQLMIGSTRNLNDDHALRSIEDQRSIDEWQVEYPRWVDAWVNKYSTRIKRQSGFYNSLYAKYLVGSYEESMEDKFFKIDQEMERLLQEEMAKPKRWYKPQKDLEKQKLKLMQKIEAQTLREEEESTKELREDTFEEDDMGLEIARRELYESVVEQQNRWMVEEPLELDGDHLEEFTASASSGASSSLVKHKRKIHPRDKDEIWDSFMSEAWVRYRYEYRDPDHPDFHGTMGSTSAQLAKAVTTGPGTLVKMHGNKKNLAASAMDLEIGASSTGALKKKVAPKKFKWIWAQIQGKSTTDMVLFLAVPERLKKAAAAAAGKTKKGTAAATAGKRNLLGNVSSRASTRGSMGVSPGIGEELVRVTLQRDDEYGNSRKIKYWYDRIRRWKMDSYRRYQLELADMGMLHRRWLVAICVRVCNKTFKRCVLTVSCTFPRCPFAGMFLCFINRIVVEANEDIAETEKELNLRISQFEAAEAQARRAAAITAAAAASSINKRGSQVTGRESTSEASSSSSAVSTDVVPQSRLQRFARRGSVAGRQSIFQSLNIGSSSTHIPAPKEFSSNLLPSEAGYGILGYDDMREDGNSLYRAVSMQLFGTQENYLFIKQQCIQHIASHPAYFCGFLDINFEYYLSIKFRSMDPHSEVTAFGDHLDLQAICEMYDVAVHIYSQVEFGATNMAKGNTGPAAEKENKDGGHTGNPDALLRNQPFIKFYDDVHPDGSKLPTILLSYAGHGHYDAIKRRSTPWPLQTALGFPVHTKTRIANLVLRARQRTEFESIERIRVEEARKAHELIATATAQAPLGKTGEMKRAAKQRKKAKRKRQVELAAAAAAGKNIVVKDLSSSSEEEDVSLETIISSMTSHHTRQFKPIDTIKMELSRTILQPRELVLSTYMGEVLFKGDIEVQTATFLDCLASCKIEYGTKKELLASGYHVQQAFSERFWHDMQMQSMSELVSQQNLEGLAAVAMYGQEDGAGGATTMTGEGLKLNLPRVLVMYPYYPDDAHLEGEELEHHRRRMRGRENNSGLPPLMLIEGVQLAVEEMVRLVRRMAKMTKLAKIRQATWLPPV